MNQTNNYYPQNDQKFDYTQQQVYPMCCCCYSISEKAFYSFVNFFDIFVAVVYLVYNGATLKDHKIANSCYLTLYSIWFILSVLSYFMYCSSKSNYGTFVHKLYAIIRMGLTILNLVFLVLGVILVINGLNKNDEAHSSSEYVSAILLYVLLFLPLGLVSINWSCILSRVVHNRGLMNN